MARRRRKRLKVSSSPESLASRFRTTTAPSTPRCWPWRVESAGNFAESIHDALVDFRTRKNTDTGNKHQLVAWPVDHETQLQASSSWRRRPVMVTVTAGAML